MNFWKFLLHIWLLLICPLGVRLLFVWEAKDEVLDDLGLGHFNQVGVATLAASVRQRRFFNFIDPDHCDLIMDSGRVAEARLIKK